MAARHDILGKRLELLADRERPPIEERDVGPGWQLPGLAAATPYLRRIAAVSRAATAGLRVDTACEIAAGAASLEGHRVGALPDREVLTVVLGAALDAGLLACDDATKTVRPGPQADAVINQPLLAWAESLPSVVHGDPLGGGDLTTPGPASRASTGPPLPSHEPTTARRGRSQPPWLQRTTACSRSRCAPATPSGVRCTVPPCARS